MSPISGARRHFIAVKINAQFFSPSNGLRRCGRTLFYSPSVLSRLKQVFDSPRERQPGHFPPNARQAAAKLVG